MNKKQRIDTAKWAVSQAIKCGASEAAVDISKSRQIEIEVRDNKIDKLKESTQNSLDLTLYVNQKYSSHTTNKLDKTELEKFIRETVSMTKYLSQSYPLMDSKKRIQIAREIEAAALGESERVISATAGYNDACSEMVKVHSNGFTGERESTFFSAGAEATLKDDANGRTEDYCYASTRLFRELPDPALLGGEAVKRAARKIGQSKIESGVYDMIVENRSVGRLMYYFYIPLRARSLQQKSSYLEGKLNQQIASDKLTIIDDPFIPRGIGSRHFDSEGIAARRRVIIDKGILKEYFIDTYYGKKLGMEPNSGSFSNISFQYGDLDLDGLVKAVKKGILVTNFIGGNANSTTGDYSFGIFGLYIENGKIIKPVNEMNITGNLDSLMKQIYLVGNDPYTYSSLRSPSLCFKDVSFSGI
jgi:PmbA protein